MNVLSLFDGMSCGQIALRELGVIPDTYYACEIDKFAIQETQHNFPNTIQLGSVTDVRALDLKKIDLLIGGSPCQGFSFAGKQLNFDDPRSALFFEYVRLWKEIKAINPNAKFLLENVNMKKEYMRVISEYLGVFPARINSNLVSAQNRDRWYWTNIKTKEVGLFNEIYSDIPQPEDKGILLKDILQDESEVDEKYYIKNPKLGFDGMDTNGKNNALRTGGKATQSKKHNYDIIKLDKALKTKPDQDKASCFTAGGNSGGNHSDMDIIGVAIEKIGFAIREVRSEDAKKQRRETVSNNFRSKDIELREDGKIAALQTSLTIEHNILFTKNYIQWDTSGKGYKSQQDRAFYEDCKHGALPSTRGEDKNGVLLNDYTLRRLTPTECARLQTIPDWYKWIVSDSQQYRMLGNGWTIDVIKHILSYL